MSTSIGLDIGSRAIKLVQLEKTPKGIRLVKTGMHLVPYKEKESEAAHLETVTKGLSQLLSELKISPGRSFNLAVSGQSVFIRSIQVIAVNYEKLRQHIRFEAEQQIPFALNEVLWDYCLINPEGKKSSKAQQKDSGQWKVMLAAIKKNLVERQQQFVRQIKGRSSLIDVGPMALYNTVAYLEPGFLKQTVVVLDLGAKGTNLVIANRGETWIRSFPLGSDRLTQAVTDKLQIHFNEAEVLKTRVELGGASEGEEGRAAQAMNPVMADLLAEIQRSIEYYQTQVSPGEGPPPKPQKVILAGGGALLKGISDQFQQKLGIPVELWSGFQRTANSSAFQGPQVQFATAMGLALRGLAACPIELNLLREGVDRLSRAKALQWYGGGSLLLILGILAMLVQGTRQDFKKKATYLDEIKQTIKMHQTYEPKIKELEVKNELLKNRVKVLYGVLRQRQRWLTVFQNLEKFLPKEVWLVSYEGGLDLTASAPDSTAGIVRIVGRSLSYQGVTEFVSNLKNSVYFTQVKPVASNIKKTESGDEVVEFQVDMKITWQ